MAKIVMTLDEQDLTEAIGLWLSGRGMRAKGKPRVEHFQGDQRDPSYTTISIEAEPAKTRGE